MVANLNGVPGYGSGFLEEAFGGLVREHGLDPDLLRDRLGIGATDDGFEDLDSEIWEYVDAAGERNAG